MSGRRHRTRRPGYSHPCRLRKSRCRHKSHRSIRRYRRYGSRRAATLRTAARYGRPAAPACRTCRAPYCPKHNSNSSRRRSPAGLRPGKPATGGTPRPVSAPGVRFRPPTGAIQKKFVSSSSAILFGNHILDTPGLTARIFVFHPAPLDFRAPNSAPRIHTRLRTQAAVVPPPGPRPKLRPAPRQLRPCCPDFFIPGCAPRQLLCIAPDAPAARSSPERFPEGTSASPPGST